MIVLLLLSCLGSPKPSPMDDTAATGPTGETDSPTDTTPTDTGPALTSRQIDDDGDGYTEREGDCNDEHSSVNPGVPEDCGTRADDDCDGWAGSGGCMGVAYWWSYVEFDWGTADLDVSASARFELIGNYSEHLCAAGGDVAESPEPPPPCPDCLWTFESVALFEDPWVSGPCEEVVDLYVPPTGSAHDAPGWLNLGWGFSSVRPETGEVSTGWLLVYNEALGRWLTLVGPDYDVYGTYVFTSTGDVASFTWVAQQAPRYEYWRYGEPTRAYNP